MGIPNPFRLAAFNGITFGAGLFSKVVGVVSAAFPNLYHAIFDGVNQYAEISSVDLGPYSDTKVSFCTEVVRGSVGGQQPFFAKWTSQNSTRKYAVAFNASDRIDLLIRTASSGNFQIITTAAFSSTVAKYNIQIDIDLANATQADRMRIYVDGVRQAVTGSPPSSPTDTLNTGAALRLGADANGLFADTTMDEVTLYDGTNPAYSDSWDGSDNAKDRSAVSGHHMTARFENNWELVGVATDLTPVNSPTFGSN